MQLLRVTDALPWEAFWLLFNVSLVVLNGIVTIGAQRGDLFRAIANTDSADVLLICFAFLGWGVGATGAPPPHVVPESYSVSCHFCVRVRHHIFNSVTAQLRGRSSWCYTAIIQGFFTAAVFWGAQSGRVTATGHNR